MTTTVQLKDHWAEQRLFLRRAIVAGIIVVGLISVVVGRLAQLQILEYEYFPRSLRAIEFGCIQYHRLVA